MKKLFIVALLLSAVSAWAQYPSEKEVLAWVARVPVCSFCT